MSESSAAEDQNFYFVSVPLRSGEVIISAAKLLD